MSQVGWPRFATLFQCRPDVTLLGAELGIWFSGYGRASNIWLPISDCVFFLCRSIPCYASCSLSMAIRPKRLSRWVQWGSRSFTCLSEVLNFQICMGRSSVCRVCLVTVILCPDCFTWRLNLYIMLITFVFEPSNSGCTLLHPISGHACHAVPRSKTSCGRDTGDISV